MEVRCVGGSLWVMPDRTAVGMNLVAWLEEFLWLPHRYTLQLFQQGRVRFGNRVLSRLDSVPASGRIWLMSDTTPGAVAEPPAEVWEFVSDTDCIAEDASVGEPSVLFEDDHVLVLDKPAGWLVHSDGATRWPVLKAWVSAYLRRLGQPDTAFHVHRLDRETTGCVLFAKHPFMARALDSLMAKRLIHRTYIALVNGNLPNNVGMIDAPIGRNRHVSGTYRVSSTGMAAITQYQRLSTSKDGCVSLVACRLQTGRTHQIRVHLASVGCPILGDAIYSMTASSQSDGWRGSGHALHAWQLRWLNPYTGESVEVEAALPLGFRRCMAQTMATIQDWEVKPW